MIGRRYSVPAALVLMTSVACGDNSGSSSKGTERSSSTPTAVRLAALQVGGPSAPASLIQDLDDVLTALEIRCTETRDTSPSLADVAINTVAASKKAGHDINHLEALRALEASIHEGADMKIDCTDAAKRVFAQY